MAESVSTPVKDLSIDLKNFRTVAQRGEIAAIQAMISINPDWFWALAESLIDDGYLPTENIIVLKVEYPTKQLIVKEGNRRIAALKLIHGYIPTNKFAIPDDILEKIEGISRAWKRDNKLVPCTIYPLAEKDVVDRIVTLTHGKGEKAGRDKWNAVARARHNRDEMKASEPGLDLLEKYLVAADNIQKDQARRWSGVYPLSVLDEAIKRAAPRLGATSAADLAKKYPKISRRKNLDEIIKDIGVETLTFKKIRSSVDFLSGYSLPAPPTTSTGKTGSGPTGSPATGKGKSRGASSGGSAKTTATGLGDTKSVTKTLKAFTITGNDREKVVDLRNEATRLDLNQNPIAFCFLLRSMFEISAKAYCADHKGAHLSAKKADGTDRALADVLRDITKHLTQDKKDRAMTKELHGAMAELGKSEGILSVTSMNQLVHNPKFSVSAHDVSLMFHNIFPLLRALNS